MSFELALKRAQWFLDVERGDEVKVEIDTKLSRTQRRRKTLELRLAAQKKRQIQQQVVGLLMVTVWARDQLIQDPFDVARLERVLTHGLASY